MVKLLSNAKNKFVSTFRPSAEVSAARRKDVFGTESKTVAAGAIIGGAVLLGAGGAAAGLAGTAARSVVAPALKASASAVGRSIAANPIKSAVVGGIGAPVLAGAIISDPKIVTRTAGGVINFQGNLIEVGKDPSIEAIGKVIKDNPVISAIAGGAVVGLTGAAAGNIISGALTRSEIEKGSQRIAEAYQTGAALPQSNASLTGSPSNVASGGSLPVVRQTSALTTTRKRRTKKPVTPMRQSQSVRVNILNVSERLIRTRTYRN